MYVVVVVFPVPSCRGHLLQFYLPPLLPRPTHQRHAASHLPHGGEGASFAAAVRGGVVLSPPLLLAILLRPSVGPFSIRTTTAGLASPTPSFPLLVSTKSTSVRTPSSSPSPSPSALGGLRPSPGEEEEECFFLPCQPGSLGDGRGGGGGGGGRQGLEGPHRKDRERSSHLTSSPFSP